MAVSFRPIRRIGIVGAGTMGSSMAQIFARYRYPVVLYNHRPEKLEKAKSAISAGLDTLVSLGKLSEKDSEGAKNAILYTTSLDDLAEVDLVVESIVEVLDVKLAFYPELCKVIAPDAILTTNTSGLSINTIASSVTHPERFLGFHWFNPPHLIPLVEIIRGEQSADEAAKMVTDLALRIHKKPAVVNKDIPGFAANRLQYTLCREALALVAEGVVSPEDMDGLLKYGLGFRWACLGPLETMDFGGLDIFANTSAYLLPDLCDSHEVPKLLKEAVNEGHLGVKTGRGFYEYSPEDAAKKTKERDKKLSKLAQALDLE